MLLQQNNWQELYFYQKSEVLYQITFAFCDKYIPLHGDRTRDQMIQAARSGKQNIVEGFADGVASSEMMLKLLTVFLVKIKDASVAEADAIREKIFNKLDEGILQPNLQPNLQPIMQP